MFAALPMYLRDETRPATDALWALIREGLRARGIAAPEALDHAAEHDAGWGRDDLVLSHICNLPYRMRHRGDTALIGVPDHAIEDTDPGYYRSYFVTRADDPAQGLADLAPRPMALNDPRSQSGWGAAWDAAQAEALVLSPALVTGAHSASMAAVADGAADWASIDAHSWWLETRGPRADVAEALKIVGRSAQSPGQSFITAPGNDVGAFREAIGAAIDALAPVHRDALRLRGLHVLPPSAYDAPLPEPPRPARLSRAARPARATHPSRPEPLAKPRRLRLSRPRAAREAPMATTDPSLSERHGAEPVIEIRDLHKAYGALEVIKGVSLRAPAGHVVSLIGSSGSGKSTLLRCANLLEDSQQGEILFCGEPVAWKGSGGARRPADRRQITRIRTNLSMVFQQFNLWAHMTILQNVMEAPVTVLGRPRAEVEAAARGYLDKVGIGDKADVYPAQLSGGQQQRAAIARALCMEPKALLFDEPTSALDPELEQEVVRVIKALAEEGRTMIIVTHDMRMAHDVSDHTVFLHQGVICEEGPPARLFGDPQTERLQGFLSATVPA